MGTALPVQGSNGTKENQPFFIQWHLFLSSLVISAQKTNCDCEQTLIERDKTSNMINDLQTMPWR